MQTVASSSASLQSLIQDEVARNPGQVPLAYVIERTSLAVFGASSFAARLPSALFAVLAVIGVWQLAKWAQVRFPMVVASLFATFPLQMRYATEARPYSQALCLGIWLTVVFTHLLRSPRLSLWCAYGVLLVLGLYTQPYVIFIAAGSCVFLLHKKRIARLPPFLFTSFIAAVIFLPWYLFVRSSWKNDLSGNGVHFHAQAKLLLEIARELTGAGYISTVILFVLCYLGFRHAKGIPQQGRWFLLVLLFAPALLAIGADAVFDYFFAVRQMLFVLVPLSVLATLGLEAVAGRFSSRLATGLAVAVLLLNLGYTIRWFTKSREDWGQAATQLEQAHLSGACIIYLPGGSARLYSFYAPKLKGAECPPAAILKQKRVDIAVSPYFRDFSAEDTLQHQLSEQGFLLANAGENQEPRILTYQRNF